MIEIYSAMYEGKLRNWTVATWASRLGMSVKTIRDGLAQGKTFEQATGLHQYNLAKNFLAGGVHKR